VRARYCTAAYVAISAFILISVPAIAAVTERVKQDCRGDYQRYCSEYAVGSEALRACMSRSIKKVSNVCVRALVDGGEMSKAQADRLRKPTASKHVTHKRTYHSKRTTKKRTTKR
jgi:hypothetical protein